MAKTPAKSKYKRKSPTQRGIPNKKKKTVVEEKSNKSISKSQSDGVADTFQVQIREKFEEELKCNICTEIFIKPTVLNCTHMFCEYCITKWKKQQEKCPICREKIDSQIRVLALDVFIEKALEVLTPEENKARAAMISQREKKDDLEEREEEDNEEEEEQEIIFREDSSSDLFSPDEDSDNSRMSGSSYDTPDFLVSYSSSSEDLSNVSSEDLSGTSSDRRSFISGSSSSELEWNPDSEDDSDVG